MNRTAVQLWPTRICRGRAPTGGLAVTRRACGWLALACCLGLGGCKMGPSQTGPAMTPPPSQMPGQPGPRLIPGQPQFLTPGQPQLNPGQLPVPPSSSDLPPPTTGAGSPARPTSRLVEHGLAVRATRQGRYAEADVHFLRAWQLGPPTAELLNDMGYRLYLEGRLAEAESVFRQAVFLEPHHVAAVLNLGKVLARQGRIAESLTVFRQVNGEAEAEANVAYVLADWGNIEVAQAHYGRAIEISVAMRQGPPAMARLPSSSAGDYRLNSPQSPAATPATARFTQVRPVD